MNKILILILVIALAQAAEKSSKKRGLFDQDKYCTAHCSIGDVTENGHTYCVPLKSVVDACEFHRRSDDSGFDQVSCERDDNCLWVKNSNQDVCMHKCFAYNCEKVGNNCEQDTTLDKIGRAIGWAARKTAVAIKTVAQVTAEVLKGAAKVASVTGKMLWHALENTAKGTIYVGGKMIDGFEWALKKWDKKSQDSFCAEMCAPLGNVCYTQPDTAITGPDPSAQDFKLTTCKEQFVNFDHCVLVAGQFCNWNQKENVCQNSCETSCKIESSKCVGVLPPVKRVRYSKSKIVKLIKVARRA